jgi:hypothetical protein
MFEDFYKGKRVLITGHTGFKGSWLAAMKAYALGRRSKWKDYVDLYFILKDHYSVKQIAQQAELIFGQLFSEKLFRMRLCFFKDIDYTEPVEYLVERVSDKEIKDFLLDVATEIF